MKQKEQIKNLKERLESAKKHHYLHHSNNVWVGDGELHIDHGDWENGNEKHLVINVDEFFKDLPFIISQVVKENQKMQDYYLGNILDEIKELKKYKR